ncbi:MAG: 6-pyruvoyl tetrahydropterin synthase family protein [Geitlerinemataceae cyanobacterium]
MHASLTVTMNFSAAHRLARPDLDPATNSKVYGKCARPNGHGHDYKLEVTVTGEVDDRVGTIVDLGVLNDLLRVRVIDLFDHRFLNKDIEHFATTVPTAENIALHIRNILQAELPSIGVALQRIKLHESPNNACEVFATITPQTETDRETTESLALA